MAVSEASRTAHRKLKTIGQLGRDERLVYEQIKFMESQAKTQESLPSRRDVAEMIGMETSSVAGRVKALIDYGLVKETRSVKRDSKTGMTVGVLQVISPADKVIGEAVRWMDD